MLDKPATVHYKRSARCRKGTKENLISNSQGITNLTMDNSDDSEVIPLSLPQDNREIVRQFVNASNTLTRINNDVQDSLEADIANTCQGKPKRWLVLFCVLTKFQ